MNTKWNQRFMERASQIATWSKDQSRKVGCVIVTKDYIEVASGYNGFPRGVDDDVKDRHERPAKYKWTEHAERNAIYGAARQGISVAGCTIFTPYYPCADCARAIIQSGIKEVVSRPIDYDDPRWGEDFKISSIMFAEAGVTVTELD